MVLPGDSLVPLAKVVRPQGRFGEVLCDKLTDFPDQFTSSSGLQLTSEDGRSRPVTVENVWQPTGRNAGRVVLKITGVDSISAADELRSAVIELPREQRIKLDTATYYVADLVGCTLCNHEQALGSVADVQFPTDTSGKHLLDAAALFVIKTESGNEVLIPFALEFVQSIDTTGRLIRCSLPDGLVDLNG